MGKTCAQLFKGLECTVIGDPDEVVEGLAYRSDAVCAHDAFFCIVGMNCDGHTFAQDAIDRGAKVLVVERKLYLADATDVTEVVVSDSRKAMAHAAANFYDNPSADLRLVGITGTNGKTTTTYLVEHIARAAGSKTGIIGTVGIQIGDERESSEHTTPESPDLQKAFAAMRDEGCDVVAMEVSSHALDLARTWRTSFAVTAFTNLTQDHLDYHQTFDAYFEAKALLFSQDYPARRVICINDKWGRELSVRCSKAGDDVVTVGYDAMAQIHPVTVEYAATCTDLTLDVRGTSYRLRYPLVGRFNVENVMCAFGIGLQLDIPADVIVGALADVPAVPGRLERVCAGKGADAEGADAADAGEAADADDEAADAEDADADADADAAVEAADADADAEDTDAGEDAATDADSGDVSVYVDYAHTPDALAKAIDAVKALTDGRVLVVFGCGGDRDKGKRPIMGGAALAADYAVVTSDNPRHEDPLAIIDDVLAGMGEGAADRFEVIPDRRQAIARAIELAEAGDSVLVAGKGHEDYQLVGDEVLSFDDRVVASEELARAASRRTRGQKTRNSSGEG